MNQIRKNGILVFMALLFLTLLSNYELIRSYANSVRNKIIDSKEFKVLSSYENQDMVYKKLIQACWYACIMFNLLKKIRLIYLLNIWEI